MAGGPVAAAVGWLLRFVAQYFVGKALDHLVYGDTFDRHTGVLTYWVDDQRKEMDRQRRNLDEVAERTRRLESRVNVLETRLDGHLDHEARRGRVYLKELARVKQLQQEFESFADNIYELKKIPHYINEGNHTALRRLEVFLESIDVSDPESEYVSEMTDLVSKMSDQIRSLEEEMVRVWSRLDQHDHELELQSKENRRQNERLGQHQAHLEEIYGILRLVEKCDVVHYKRQVDSKGIVLEPSETGVYALHFGDFLRDQLVPFAQENKLRFYYNYLPAGHSSVARVKYSINCQEDHYTGYLCKADIQLLSDEFKDYVHRGFGHGLTADEAYFDLTSRLLEKGTLRTIEKP